MAGAEKRVLLVGAGGLGSAAAMALAREAGPDRIASITFCDADLVELANLHRQVLHRASDVGRAKVDSAASAISRFNSAIEVRVMPHRLDAGNALAAVGEHDVVIDGSDNFPTKFLVNDACMLAGVPFVHGGAIRWIGQLLAVDPRAADPCYRCLFEAPPPPAAGASCAEAGVAGPVVGVIGALQAEAALALLDGRTAPGQLLTYDGLTGRTRTVRFRKSPACTACGPGRATALDPRAYEVEPCAAP